MSQGGKGMNIFSTKEHFFNQLEVTWPEGLFFLEDDAASSMITDYKRTKSSVLDDYRRAHIAV